MQHLAWESVRLEVLNEKLSRKVVNGEKVMVAQLQIRQGLPGAAPSPRKRTDQPDHPGRDEI